MEATTYRTNYTTAVKWCNNSLILCNDIAEIDPTVYDNMEFDYYDEENDQYIDIYQWYLTDCSQWDVNFLKEHFGLLFTYSDKLDLFVLCVDHFGTAWSGVMIETDLEMAQRGVFEGR